MAPRRSLSIGRRTLRLASRRTARRTVRRAPRRTAAWVVAALALSVTLASPAQAGNRVTPGDFTGYGFDQCLAPSQASMDAWLEHSPFLAVGIYISGDSRGCRSQPNLTPEWIATQLAKGWRLLPITLGPQASCNPSFPRYGNDETIDPTPGEYDRYPNARRQARAEVDTTLAVAARLGISPGSTLWYDLESFDITRTRCRESALAFLSEWSYQIRRRGYVSGVYSSAGSGIKMLDDARVNRPGKFHLPDYIWIARWDGVANTRTSYIRDDGWQPHRRVKQYQGGHQETWGGVTINIDRNFLDVGRGTVAPPPVKHCGGTHLSFPTYPILEPGSTHLDPVKALQCLLKERGLYAGAISGSYDAATIAAAKLWQAKIGLYVRPRWNRVAWRTLLTAGWRPVAKYGSSGDAVRRVQRALNAVTGARLTVDGIFGSTTDAALREWQERIGLPRSGVVNQATWTRLQQR